MGHQLIMLSVLASIFLSAGMITMVQNWQGSSRSVATQYNVEQANNVSNSGIQLSLSKLRLNRDWRTGFTNLALAGGTCTLTVTDIGTDSVQIRSTGTFSGATHTCIVRAKLRSIFPVVESALTMYGDSVTFSNAGKSFSIDGNDYLEDGTTKVTGGTPVYGMGVYQQKTVNQLKKYLTDGKVESNVDGKNGAPSVGLFTNNELIDSLHNMYKSLATITLSAGKYSGNATFGSSSVPEVVYCPGDMEWTGTIAGYGILVVSGDLVAKGGVTWKGIVIAYSADVDMNVGSSGTPNFLGTCFIGTANSKKINNVHFNGNPYVRYSSATIRNVLTKLNLMSVEVISYYE
jgi:hypothetical protein